MFGFSIAHWLILLAVVLVIFGTGKLRNVGRDLGDAIAGFRKGLKDESSTAPGAPRPDLAQADDERRS